MDTLSRYGLIFLALIFGAFFSLPSQANTPAAALAACTSKLSAAQANTYGTGGTYAGATCQFVSADLAGIAGYYFVGGNAGRVGCGGMYGEIPGSWQDCITDSPAPPDDSACAKSDEGDDSPTQTWVVGKIGTGWTSCQSQQSPSGQWVQCGHTVSPDTPPYYDPQLGQWRTKVTYAATHQLCASGSSSDPQSTSWKDGAGNTVPVANAPPNPPKPLPTTQPPAYCGGGSCYDPNSDRYCAVAGGQQICVPGNTARTTGGCYSDGSSSICAGAPPPSPPPPPASPISDPPGDIQSSDKTTQADPNTGANVTVTTNVYTQPGMSVSNGAKPGDVQPASASSTGTPSGTGMTGGLDCNTPPVCTGDSVLCGTARMQWAQLCRLHKDVGSDQPAPSLSSLSPASAGSVWTSSTSTGDATADAALQGNFDSSGFGYSSQCPMKDLTVDISGHSFAVPFSEGCVIGPWLYYIILGMATFWAAIIVAKGA